MRASWPAIILAPLFALADQSAAYALVEWSCAKSHPGVPNIVHALFLTLALATFFMAWSDRARPAAREDAGDAATGRSFLSTLGMMGAALSALVIVALWYPMWVLSPCHG